ncbi:pectinesterase family protein [Hymenobacter convexus]|uniref:pectinesterase family protein n=1 Tax=Hymenobacter sp. CA1UV-4 TaxID=3063782 RepID=UPI002712CC07|nr:pectinesterase family protein [Hymenobacter sp. CA1UV-4]MDO7854104.1 pectinesterase family protein [Hymenobacter sp. CA1UV-4]
MILRRFLLAGSLLLASQSLFAQATPPTPAVPAKVETFLVPIRLTVAPDGSGDYRTVQEAVLAVRDFMQVTATIFIKNGTYKEKLLVPSQKTHITLLGESREGVVITFGDYSGDAEKHSTYSSSTARVQGNDFTAENITFENSAGPVGQAVALHVEGDRATFRHCRMLGNQDTLFPATENSRQYYQDCYIEGTTDFIFGGSTVVFDHCTIFSKSNSYITAASTSPRQKFGFVFLDCTLTAAPAATKVYLGRPWRPHSNTVFLNTEMGAHITAAGWDNWHAPTNEQTAYYAEFNSRGPGANSAGRVKWAHQLTAKEAKKYTLKTIFGGSQPWEPRQN